MTFWMSIVASLAALIVAVPTSDVTTTAQPAPNARVARCLTEHKGNRYVTHLYWSDATNDFQTDMEPYDLRSIPGRRIKRRDGYGPEKRIVSCNVRGYNIWLNIENGAKWQIRQPRTVNTVTPVLVVELPPLTPPPAVTAVWRTAPKVYAPVPDSWNVNGALAAWNSGLPARMQLTRVFEPCDACITIGLLDEMTHRGLAYAWSEQGAITSCKIELLSTTSPTEQSGITAHEVGHCLGFGHWHGSWERSVMSGDGISFQTTHGPTENDYTVSRAAYPA